MGMARSKRHSLIAIGACVVFINLTNILWTLNNKDFQDSQLDRNSFIEQSERRSLKATPSYRLENRHHDEQQQVFSKLVARRVVDLSDLNLNMDSGWKAGYDERGEDSEDECLPMTKTIERGTTVIIDDSDCMQEEWEENCEPVTKSFGHSDSITMLRPMCNSFHELDLVDAYKPSTVEGYHIEVLGQGGYRSAFKLSPASRSNSTHENRGSELLLKLFGGEKEWQELNKAFLHSVAMDSFTMEVLSSSKYVADSFGFCGSSQFTEIADETGYSIFEDETLSLMDRLLIGRDLARGLADLHTLVTHAWEVQKKDSTHPLV